MAAKKPLVQAGGQLEQIDDTDTLIVATPTAAASTSMRVGSIGVGAIIVDNFLSDPVIPLGVTGVFNALNVIPTDQAGGSNPGNMIAVQGSVIPNNTSPSNAVGVFGTGQSKGTTSPTLFVGVFGAVVVDETSAPVVTVGVLAGPSVPGGTGTTFFNYSLKVEAPVFGVLQWALHVTGLTELFGDLMHTGVQVGFYGAPVVVQAADPVALTDSTGGTANNTVAAVAGSGADVVINDNFADLTAKYNLLRTIIRNIGIAA